MLDVLMGPDNLHVYAYLHLAGFLGRRLGEHRAQVMDKLVVK